LKLFSFSVRGELVEPQKNTFARASKYNDLNTDGFVKSLESCHCEERSDKAIS
jgi:hypothetical protein